MICTCYAEAGGHDEGNAQSLWAPRLRKALSRAGARFRAISGWGRARPDGRFSQAELLWFGYNRDGYLPDRPFGPF
jgi:hypothetical protein